MRFRRAVAGILLALVAAQVLWIAGAVLLGGEQRSFTGARLDDFDGPDVREITFRNEEQGVELAGLLFVPEGPGPFPGAVVIHGSGTSRRDNGWYLTLVEYLQSRGVAVLLPDKRGSERSGGDWRTAGLEDLATDAVAAVGVLARQERVDGARIGVIGLSQGGRYAPLVANRDPRVAFVVSVVGGVVPAHDALVYEETHNLRELGVLPGVADAMARVTTFLLRHGGDRAFWRAVGNFDPLPHWRALATPALALYGELDTNVPTRRSTELLRGLGKPNVTVRVYEGSGHALEDPPGQGSSIFRADALSEIRSFIVRADPVSPPTAPPPAPSP